MEVLKISQRASETLIAVGGGDQEQARSIEYFDTIQYKWTKIESIELNVNRVFYRTVLFEGKLIMVGGRLNAAEAVATVESYDPATGQVNQMPSMTQARDDCALVIISQDLYAIGGYGVNGFLNTAEKYNSNTNQWTSLSSMSIPRTKCGAVTINGEIFVIGGVGIGEPLSSVEAYNPQNGTWRMCASMTQNRSGVAVALLNNSIYAMGGWQGSEKLSTAERYDPFTDSWTFIQDNYFPRDWCEAAAYDNTIILAGGRDEKGDDQTVVQQYHPDNYYWSNLGELTMPRVYFSLILVPEEIVKNLVLSK